MFASVKKKTKEQKLSVKSETIIKTIFKGGAWEKLYLNLINH